ncbi:endonuclease/exonuclease/phosphatase family protein [Jiella avicenniae]|uniref:Endonuclease/exonuclease/phosphatase family protein n=1 Tax=Jiella avicenniae TaxID=2907202 RepID=A0A9X1T5Q8_9HYPH|nr:endonuclease/exonuclease/phosphatase family protein [Jiella avicenniae]MCE7029109.1 endonuclease/exonuclease/phosphatase family protein [Jiella avicenniae]
MTTSLSRITTSLLLGASLIVAAALVAGFFGRAVPFFDSLAQFRAHLTVALFGLALCLIVLRSVAAATIAAIVAAYAAVSVSPFLVPRPAAEPARPGPDETALVGRGPLKLLQMNLRYDADPVRAVTTIARLDPDVLTLQEINRRWVEALEPLRSGYPYSAFCGVTGAAGGLAILSRIPFAREDAVCRDGDGFLARRLDLGNGAGLTVVSEHLEWPWPFRQGRQVAALGTEVLPKLRMPVLIAGDFNAAPWSATVQRYAEASRTRPATGIGPTWLTGALPDPLRPLVGLPLDNVLASHGVRLLSLTRQEATASDHLPILVAFDVPAASGGDVAPARFVGRDAAR